MLRGKKVLVIGLAKSGQAAVELLERLHASITVNEYAAKENIACYDDYIKRGIRMVVGGHPDSLLKKILILLSKIQESIIINHLFYV